MSTIKFPTGKNETIIKEDEEEVCEFHDFGDNFLLLSNKDMFLAEYNSLRNEILQRISQQTTINQITITVWG